MKSVNDAIKKAIKDSNRSEINTLTYEMEFNVTNRTVRRCLSELYREKVYYLPLGNGYYQLYRGTDDDYLLAEKCARTIQKSIRTQYHNRLRTMLPIIKDEKLRKEIGQGILFDVNEYEV